MELEEIVSLGVIFGMLALILVEVSLLQGKVDQIKEQGSEKRRGRSDKEADQGTDQIALGE